MPVDQIVAKDEGAGSQRVPEGQYMGVACDIIDLGMVETTWQGQKKQQHKCAIVFQLDEINPSTNKPYEIAERFTVSMNDRARLRKFLGDWRGRAYTEAEAREGTPLHKLEGVNALVQVEHRESPNGKTYANIGSIMRAPKGSALRQIVDYVRSPNWKKDGPPVDEAPPIDESGQYDDGDSDLPFDDGGMDTTGHDSDELFATMPPQHRNAIQEGR